MPRKSFTSSAVFVPVALLCAFIIVGFLALTQGKQEATKQQEVAQDAAPPLNLPLVTNGMAEKRFDLKEMKGQKVLVNYFASWCAPCVTELPQLRKIARQNGLAIIGVAYNDNINAVLGFFEKHGSAYARVLLDPNGQSAIDWGVRAVPESFLVDEYGRLVARYPGPITNEVWANVFARHLPPPVIQ